MDERQRLHPAREATHCCPSKRNSPSPFGFGRPVRLRALLEHPSQEKRIATGVFVAERLSSIPSDILVSQWLSLICKGYCLGLILPGYSSTPTGMRASARYGGASLGLMAHLADWPVELLRKPYCCCQRKYAACSLNRSPRGQATRDLQATRFDGATPPDRRGAPRSTAPPGRRRSCRYCCGSRSRRRTRRELLKPPEARRAFLIALSSRWETPKVASSLAVSR